MPLELTGILRQRIAGRLESELSRRLGKPVVLRLNRNRRVYFSCRQGPRGLLRLSVHQCFADATPAVLDALAALVDGGSEKASAVCREFVARYDACHEGTNAAATRVNLRPKGQVHDLSALAAVVDRREFKGRMRPRITWGRRPREKGRKRPRSIRLGSYDHNADVIRINPILDSLRVPEAYLDYLIFHEMLHKHFGVHERDASGRRRIHDVRFKDAERRHPCYEAAARWEKEFFERYFKREKDIYPTWTFRLAPERTENRLREETSGEPEESGISAPSGPLEPRQKTQICFTQLTLFSSVEGRTASAEEEVDEVD